MVIKIVTNADTGTADIVGGDDWDSLATLVNNYVASPEFSSYYVYKSGSTYYSRNSATKAISSGSDAGIIIQAAMTGIQASTRGGLIYLSPEEFPVSTPLDIPTSTTPRPVALVGTYANNRDYGTMLAATSSFPTNRSIIETSGATDTSLKHTFLYIKNIGMSNLANFDTKVIGGIKFETDYAARRRQLIVDGFYANYIHKGITLQGPVWWSYFNNLNFEGANASFSGNWDIKLEQTGTYTHTDPTVNGWPKSNHFNNIIAVRNPGTMVNSLWVDAGGYNTFNNYMVDATGYTDAVLRFGSNGTAIINDNTMFTPWVLDTTEPGGAIGDLVLDGANTYGNKFYNSKLSRVVYTVTIKNGSYRNYVQLAGYWGAHAAIDNVGCGNWNVIELMHGSLAEASTENKATFTGNSTENGKIRVIDNRKGAIRRGVSIQSGDASTAAFNIAHGCYTTPITWNVTPASTDAKGSPVITATSTNLVVTYAIAPPSGTNNLTWSWLADVWGDS